MTGLLELSPGLGFEEACRLVLRYLQDHVPLGFWAITRVENGRQTYLTLDDNVYGLAMGGSHPWDDSYCIHMAADEAPRIAPDAAAVPVYAAAKINRTVPIGAYVGAPIHEADGGLFGAICGLDPQRQPADLADAGPLLELLSRLLELILTSERRAVRARRATLLARSEATSDALTGLLNRRGWDQIVADEAERYQQFADPTVVVMVDLDDLKTINDHGGGHVAGDRYLVAAAGALSAALREGDPVARIGGDEFGIVLNNCTSRQAPERVARLGAALDAVGVSASLGWSAVTLTDGVSGALHEADQAMYQAKRERQRLMQPADGPTGA